MVKKNSRIITLAVAAAVMMAVTACGSKDKTETAAATEAAATEAAATETAATAEPAAAAESAGTSAAETESMKAESRTEDTEEDAEEDTVEETTASAAGKTGADGIFKAADGKFEIKVPAGWTIDEGSDGEYVTFFSANGEDMLEIVNISGSSADSIREVYPDTAEEYRKMVSRDDAMEILSYDVKSKEDGSQIFQYSMKYGNPSDGVRYLAQSGSYDAAKQTYSCVAGTVKSSGDAVVKQVNEAVKSFKITE